MKIIYPLFLVCGLAFAADAQETTKAATETAAPTNAAAAPVVTLQAADATVTAPLVLTNGSFSQPDTTELAGGGKAIFTFAITNEGDYVITAQISAPDEGSNSFFINVDADPQDPLMVWDIDVTSGYETRTVSWRGNGDANSDEISPKKFHLTAGDHKLIIVGREPTGLKSVAICPAAK